jgi:histidine triad (HIT) family protein
MPTIFTRIINGEIPCYKVAESDQFFAFLDIRPQTKGHTLCVTKREVDYIFDLSDEELAGLMAFSKRVAAAISAVVPSQRIGVAVIGLEVPHTHVHLFPLNSMADFGFGKPIVELSSDEMQALAAAIAAQYK